MSYTPSQKTLERFADVLINFGLGEGNGIRKGDVVNVVMTEVSRPLLPHLEKSIYKAGGHIILDYLPNGYSRYTHNGRALWEHGNEKQIKFFPKKYVDGILNSIDHMLVISAENNPFEYKGIDPKRIMATQQAWGHYLNKRLDVLQGGKKSWCLTVYGTEAMARAARLSIEKYWGQIIKAMFLDKKDPIAHTKKVMEKIYAVQEKLNNLCIQKIHMLGEDIDLHLTVGSDRKWLAGRGSNVPSFEIFTTPDWRGTEGWIYFNTPLYRHGNSIEGIRLEFKKGKVVKASAKKNEKILKAELAIPYADRLGEFSLTDKRHSRINKFMATTQYDENFGGEYGNTHVAIGGGFKDAYVGKKKPKTDSEWRKLGINISAAHTDIFSTTNRTVTATLSDGSEKVIYKDGKFTV